MQNLVSLWSGLTVLRKAIVAGASIAMFLAILFLSHIGGKPQMSLLYSGLDATAAGQVITALEQRGVVFSVEGDSIRVPSTERDALRMTLAGEGLPASGSAGYELLDGLSGFGTTSQMFDAAYWRAKEGELARTILAAPSIRAARVHIAQAPSHPFRRDGKATASVTVTTAGQGVSANQASAFRHLIAAAVPGLSSEDVSVIDSVGGLVPLEEAQGLVSSGEARAEALRRRLERLLEARVGPGRAIVEVAIDLDTKSETLTERVLDPQGRVVLSSDTEERNSSERGQNGAVTVASNLPDGDASSTNERGANRSETRERINYEISETRREVVQAPGMLRRLSVAVLIDGTVERAADGTPLWQPRSEEELAALKELVASAAGIDPVRGDVLTLRSLPFETLPEMGSAAEVSIPLWWSTLDLMALIQVVVVAALVVILGLFVLRPLLLSGRVSAKLDDSLPLSSSQMAGLPALGGAEMAMAMAPLPDFSEPFAIAEPAGFEMPLMNSSNFAFDQVASDPAERLRKLIEARQSETIAILRNWMEEEEVA